MSNRAGSTPGTRKRDPLALKSSEVRIGMTVVYQGAEWGVWAQAPGPGRYWLTQTWRDEDGELKSRTVEAGVEELARVTRRSPGA